MNTITNIKFHAIISQIKETEGMIKTWREALPDPGAKLMVWQFEELKRGFVKELLVCLVESDLNASDFEPFFRKATAYLKKFDNKNGLDKRLKTELSEVEKMMDASISSDFVPKFERSQRHAHPTTH